MTKSLHTFLNVIKNLFNSWTWKMAWRDSRSQRKKLVLFLSSNILGVAALVSLQSFSKNVTSAINNQAKKLLGADLVVRSRSPFSQDLNDRLDHIPGDSSRELRFSTMAYFSNQNETRLVQIRAQEGAFPYYGKIETIPGTAVTSFHNGLPNAIVEEALLLQFDARVGDIIRLGDVNFRISGRLQKIPGETLMISELAPRVLIPMEFVAKTNLIKIGSRVFYRRSFRYQHEFEDTKLVNELEAISDQSGIRFDTIETRKKSLGKRLENLFHFLNIVVLTALLLGGIGIGSAMHVYIKRKIPTLAILRCIGATLSETYTMFLLQALVLGLTGGIVGSFLGIFIQQFLPYVFRDLLPIDIEVTISGVAILNGVILGVFITLIFSLIPLLYVRLVSPLFTLRAELEPDIKRDPLRFAVYFIIAFSVVLFSLLTAHKWQYGLSIGAALIIAFLMLIALANLLMIVIRIVFPKSIPYIFQQGLKNLYRPHNQTLTLILSLGIGTFMIMTLYLSQIQILNQVKRSDEGNNPNIVLFDIQIDQLDSVKSMLETMNLPILQVVPMVTMRLGSVKGKPVEDIRLENRSKNDDNTVPDWVLNREYRSTYRDHLINSETLLDGKLIKAVSSDDGTIPITIEKDIAEDLDVTIGDELVFDVQGIPIKTNISGIRKIDWYKIQPNFFVVFPEGILEDAPQMIVVVTRVTSAALSAQLQRETVKRFANLSVIDMALVVNSIASIMDKVAYAVEFMAVFSIIIGFIVLISSINLSRYQRIRECVLLKILGASKRQIIGIMSIEYFLLGALAANAGIILSLIGSFLLAKFVFETNFSVNIQSVMIANVVVVGSTMIIGLMSSISTYKQPPLAVLRNEAD